MNTIYAGPNCKSGPAHDWAMTVPMALSMSAVDGTRHHLGVILQKLTASALVLECVSVGSGKQAKIGQQRRVESVQYFAAACRNECIRRRHALPQCPVTMTSRWPGRTQQEHLDGTDTLTGGEHAYRRHVKASATAPSTRLPAYSCEQIKSSAREAFGSDCCQTDKQFRWMCTVSRTRMLTVSAAAP